MKLYEAYKKIISGKSNLYVLEGDTCSGKTALLNVLKYEHKGRCAVLLCDDVVEDIMSASKKSIGGEERFNSILLEYTDRFQSCEYLCVEDCESIYGKEAITFRFRQIIKHMKERVTVILTCRTAGWLKEYMELKSIQIAELDHPTYEKYGITDPSNTEHGYISTTKDSKILSAITRGGKVYNEKLCEFYSMIRIGDSFMVQGKDYEATCEYIAAWMLAMEIDSVECRIIAISRFQTTRYFESNGTLTSFRHIHVNMKEFDGSETKDFYLILRDRIASGEIDRAEYCFMLVEELI